MFELRILSGLHRGATLPLDSRTHLIGAGEDADVVLVDPDIEQRHATLKLVDAGWELATLEGRILSADSNEVRDALHLAPGDFARIGAVWVTVVDQDARWRNPPPEPADQASVALSPDPSDSAASAAAKIPVNGDETATHADGTANTADSAASAAEDIFPTAGKARRAGLWQRLKETLKRRRLAYVLLPFGVVLSAAAAYAITARTDLFQSSAQKETASPAFEAPAAKPAASTSGKPADKTVAKAFDSVHKDGRATRALTGEELRKAFRKRLADADLLKRFDLTLQENQWFMQAALDEEEAARFERILTVFIKTHNISFPVHAKVGGADAMLPFKIRQVISGVNASVITDDGQQLFIGDEHRGVRLVAIHGNRISFGGKRKIEVRW